jgi:hypothetical protein
MKGIGSGTPLLAPQGYKNLVAGETYYFLRSSPKTGYVTLIRFVLRPSKQVEYKGAQKPKRTVTPQPLPLVERMPRDLFESGVGRHITPGERQSLPPWLDGLSDLDLDSLDSERRDPARTHADRIDDKLLVIHPLVQRAEELIDSDDLEALINQHARALAPKRNETRVRLWLFTFLVFGRNRNALFYPIHKIGQWDRLTTVSDVKRGTPGELGKLHGHNTTKAMYDKIIASYIAEQSLGCTEPEIYVSAMRKHFGCKTREVTRGHEKLLEIYHPKGEPFPQEGAYFYHVKCHFNLAAVRRARLGRNRARAKIDPIKGAFTESTWNLMQVVEADGYRVYELPRGYVEGSDLPPLVVITKRDTASGKKTGIGFSQGSETGSAYRMATFCEAIGLEAFGRLFGLKIKSPGKGLSPVQITDRGPGATSSAIPRDSSLLPIVRELTPSYSGVSKALVETSNPKTPTNDEAPSFVRSKLTVIQLVRREIFKLLAFNAGTNVSTRLDPSLEHRVTSLSPNGIWEALESVGRNDAIDIAFADAVRACLEHLPATLTRAGIELAGRNYYSKSSEFQSALESVGGARELPVKVYVLTACIRHIWIDWDGRLIELDVRYPVPVANEVKYMSLEEAVEYYKHMQDRERRFKRHARAVSHQIADDYEDQTGLKWQSGQRTSGRPKRGGVVARREAAEAASSTAGRKAA